VGNRGYHWQQERKGWRGERGERREEKAEDREHMSPSETRERERAPPHPTLLIVAEMLSTTANTHTLETRVS
jgi:hypothetical protein